MVPANNHISLTEAAARLGVHYMTAYRYVRTGRLPATKDGHEWQVAERDVAGLQRDLAEPTHTKRRRSRRRDYPDRIVERLLRSDEAGAWTLIETARAGGMEADQVYLELLAPALDTIGDRWEKGLISVADEHRASAIVLRLIGRLGPNFARRGRRRGTVLLGTPPHEHHGIPTALMSDLLRGHGFDTIDLGPDVPVDSWAAAASGTTNLIAVGLCVTTPGNDEAVRDVILALRSVTDVPVLLGGSAIASDDEARALGASVFSTSFEHARSIVDDLSH